MPPHVWPAGRGPGKSDSFLCGRCRACKARQLGHGRGTVLSTDPGFPLTQGFGARHPVSTSDPGRLSRSNSSGSWGSADTKRLGPCCRSFVGAMVSTGGKPSRDKVAMWMRPYIGGREAGPTLRRCRAPRPWKGDRWGSGRVRGKGRRASGRVRLQ